MVNEPKVVVVLPFIKDKVLMQLRDKKKGIAFPGHWGFFGGAIDNNELPLDAALRELKEELDLTPIPLCFLGNDFISNHNFSYIYSFPLAVDLANIKLREGLDLELVSLKDIRIKHVRSKRLGKSFPIVPFPFIAKTIRKCLGESIKYDYF